MENEILNLIKSIFYRGCERETKERDHVINEVLMEESTFCASDIACGIDKINNATVYSTLNRMEEKGIIKRVPTTDSKVFYTLDYEFLFKQLINNDM